LLEDLNKQYHSEDVQSIIKDARSILAKFSEEYDNIKPQIRTITSLTSKLLLESLAIANNIKNALDDISPIIREEAKELKGCSKELISKTNKQYNELVTYIDQHKEQLDKLINHTTKTYSNFQKSKFAWLIGLSEPAQDEDVDS
jgi:folate-dependent tRNA-U54 methylase TrmFO/GidA